MTGWGDGPTGSGPDGALPQAGPSARNSADDTRIVVLVAMFVTAILLVGVGAFLVGRGSNSETVSPAPATSSVLAPSNTSSPTSPASTTAAPPITDAPTTSAPDPSVTTDDPNATASSTTIDPGSAIAASTTAAEAVTTTTEPSPADIAARAQADLELHFANHDRVDLDAAYGGLSPEFAPPFDEFVRFWSTDVATVDSPIDECSFVDEVATCTVRFFITYSAVAGDESLRGQCTGQLVDLALRESSGRFLIDSQRNIETLSCP
ncbi:MAG: hypothetical protein AB8G14_05115 [Ilumatobacter sp.]